MDLKRIHARIMGRVQGVSFRAFVEQAATDLGLVGWVRNCPDGSVELEAEGTHQKVEELLRRCRQGPRLARVDDVAVDWREPTGMEVDFCIRCGSFMNVLGCINE